MSVTEGVARLPGSLPTAYLVPDELSSAEELRELQDLEAEQQRIAERLARLRSKAQGRPYAG